MTLTINGKQKDFNLGTTILEIITMMKLQNEVMAVAVNMEVVKEENWNIFTPKQDDKIEFLQFVGGG